MALLIDILFAHFMTIEVLNVRVDSPKLEYGAFVLILQYLMSKVEKVSFKFHLVDTSVKCTGCKNTIMDRLTTY